MLSSLELGVRMMSGPVFRRLDCGARGSSHTRAGIARAPCSASREVESGLSGEALTMFHDAQRNILELNKSRLMALDELKQAKERISELEALCAEYQQALDNAPSGASAPDGGQAAPSRPAPSRAGTITIAYSTGWDTAFIHYQSPDGTWTDLPGEQMQPDSKQPGLFMISVPHSKLEFVFNNGDNDWDSPLSGNNYLIEEPGEFLVQSGTVSKLS
eukprot:jgi/Ulvmu1/1897/UM012_0055.1